MTTYATNFNIEDVYTTEKDKNSFDYLQKSMDYLIADLVTDKKKIKQFRNLYEGVRNKEEFKYLENTFGIETPMSVRMTPLIKTRIDVLLGLLLDDTFTYKVSVNDLNTLDLMSQEKVAEKVKRIKLAYEAQMQESVSKVEKGEEVKEGTITSAYITKLNDMIDEDFVSSFEIAAQSLIKFFEQDNTVNLKQKIKQFFLDLLVTGEGYYRTSIPIKGSDPIIEICKPENIFYSKNTSHQFISVGSKPNVNSIVHRKWVKRNDILSQLGHLMNDSDKKKLYGNAPSEGGSNTVHSPSELDYIHSDSEAYRTSHTQFTNSSFDWVPVYHVEWLANNEIKLTEEEKENLKRVEKRTATKENDRFYGKNEGSGNANNIGYRLDRYEGIRIGHDIYLEMGKSVDQPRSESNPWETVLSYNGCAYNDRNGTPYSVAGSLKDLQDSYDIITFFRDNLIANSGVDGSRINLAAIPKVLGQNFMERLMKFMALRKQGVELIDPTEDGAHLFQHYGDFRAGVDGNVVQSLQLVKEAIEKEADIVSGVNRYMYAAAEQRDAVTNVKTGIKQVSLITKDLFELTETVTKHALADLINQAKLTYTVGKRGSYIVGERNLIFDLAPQNFRFTDFNIHINNSSKENLKVEKVIAMIPELAGGGIIEPEVLMEIAMIESPTEILKIVRKSMAARKEENNIANQLKQQLDQASEQLKGLDEALKQSNKQIEALETKSNTLKERDLKLKEKAQAAKEEIDRKRLSLESEVALQEIAKDKAVVELEREQLYAENVSGNAKEVKNNI